MNTNQLSLLDSVNDYNGQAIPTIASGPTTYQNPQTNQNSRVNHEVDLDGSGDYFDADDNSSFSFSNAPFSISSWITLDIATGNRAIVSKGSVANYEWELALLEGKLTGTVYIPDGSAYIGRQYTTVLSTNVTYHVGVSYNGGTSNESLIVYLDGSAIDNANCSNGVFTVMQDKAESVKIGHRDATLTYFNGLIDDVRIYSTNTPASHFSNLHTYTHPTNDIQVRQ